jgi:uncharacterized protein YdaL
MKEGKDKNSTIGEDNIKAQHESKFHWKVIHHSLIFWIFAILMLIGIIYFVMTFGFALIPY